ncbi:MAG: hypothetical protein MJ230_01710 [bacterium]|nr:hypothetical protein [bacterium]
MTRAEMRRKAKEIAKENKVLNFKTAEGQLAKLTAKDVKNLTNLKEEFIAQMKLDCMSEASDAAFILLLSIPLIVAKDWLGFGNKRLNEFYHRIMKTYGCYLDGYVKLSELMQILYDETNFKTDFQVDKAVLEKWDTVIKAEK